jgi:hypothetical protein
MLFQSPVRNTPPTVVGKLKTHTHMKKIILFTLIVLLILGCKPKCPLRLEDGMTSIKDLPFDTITIEDIKINGLPLRITSDVLIEKFGQPDTIWEYGGAFTPKEFLIDSTTRRPLREELINHRAYFYKGLRFAVWNNDALLEEINFMECDYKLDYNGFEFSKRTTIKDFKKMYPNSYKWQKLIPSTFSISKYVGDNQISEKNITSLHLISNKYSNHFVVEFAFVNKRLTCIYFPRYE